MVNVFRMDAHYHQSKSKILESLKLNSHQGNFNEHGKS